MTLAPIQIPSGISRNGTQYQTKGRWYDGNLVRWYDGQLRPIGGWVRTTTSAAADKIRRMISWGDNTDGRWIGLGTSTKLYVNRGAGVLYDVTPVGFVGGTDDATETLGYGGGPYGAAAYGTAREGGTYFPPQIWFLDNWGQNMVACARSDGKIYEWALDTGTAATVVANAPTSNLGILVSDERHLIALGAGGNRRKVQWSDKEDNETWTPAATNEAGSFELQTDGTIVGGTRVRGQILVVTDTDAHAMRYIGSPFIFSRERVGVNCGCASAGALISVESFAYWMGRKSFWMFDGAVVRPLPCEVSDYVFNDIALINSAKITSGHNWIFGEIWWFYPSATSLECDKYVIYNYREDHWSVGTLARTSWVAGDIFGSPYAAGTDNHVYQHEEGWTDNGSTRVGSIFVESGAYEIPTTGEQVMHIHQLIPDEATSGEVSVSFKTRFTPNGTEYSYGPYTVRGDGYTDCRVAGRQVVVRIEPTVDDDFRVGVIRAEVKPGGRR